ncbi:MAG: hypothetical protein ACMXX8_00405 [Candidatus Woesearchaeota archaeon]
MDKNDNGLPEISESEKENEILPKFVINSIEKTKDLEKETKKLHNEVFGSNLNSNNEVNNENDKNLVDKIKNVVDNFDANKYLTLDLKVKDKKDLDVKTVIDTNLLEKVIYKLSSIDTSTKTKYENKLMNKYLTENPIDKWGLIIDQNQKNLNKLIEKYSSFENNNKSIFKEINKEKKDNQKKLIYCNSIVKNCSDLIDIYNEQIDRIKSNLNKAYNENSSGAVIANLEENQEEIISKIEENKSIMNQSVQRMKQLDLHVDYLLKREDQFRKSTNNINQNYKNFILMKDYLDVVRKQYDLSLKINSLYKDDSNLTEFAFDSIKIAKDINSINDIADNNLLQKNNSFSDQLEELLKQSDYNGLTNYGEDIEKIKTEAEKLITQRRKKDYKRISHLK